jgi:metal-responsive CopG/Arc/MetJ family transcriptional regulator
MARKHRARTPEATERSAKTSFSLPPQLLADLDDLTRKMGYQERSKTLHAAIRAFVDQSRIAGSPDAYATGTILVLFDHTKRSVEMITQFTHQFGALVISTLHVHLPEPNYLYVMVVRGKIADIVELERHLRKLDGINQLKVSYVMTEPYEKNAGAS